MGIITILWERWREFRRDFVKITLSAMVMPLMYLIVFGMGIKTVVDGRPYLYYLIPGVVALTTMNGSFNSVAQSLQVQRVYEKALDQVLISPTPLWQFIVGQILAGAIRGFYVSVIVLLMTLPLHMGLVFRPLSFLVLFVNGCIFAALGVVVSFLAKSHTDVPRFSNFFIMPMAYLCNTFFSTENMPAWANMILKNLPLSQCSIIVRSIAYQQEFSFAGFLILMAYLILLSAAGIYLAYSK